MKPPSEVNWKEVIMQIDLKENRLKIVNPDAINTDNPADVARAKRQPESYGDV